jgi:hypothetical protein
MTYRTLQRLLGAALVAVSTSRIAWVESQSFSASPSSGVAHPRER